MPFIKKNIKKKSFKKRISNKNYRAYWFGVGMNFQRDTSLNHDDIDPKIKNSVNKGYNNESAMRRMLKGDYDKIVERNRNKVAYQEALLKGTIKK